jgi:glycerol-3-phosphate dehydrogenase
MTRIPSQNAFDLIVIGAGINGAGIARDAAMRGLQVLLIDKGDMASGTTSASTRLIHGGLRYLEHGELGLVRESLREREILFRVAPHLVKPLALLIPIYKNRRRSRLKIRAGLIAYDLLSIGKSVPNHEVFSKEETFQIVPGIKRDNLLGSAVYYDGHVEFPERLVLENVISAQESGASVLTYAKVDRIRIADRRVEGIEITNQLSGKSSFMRSSVVVNAAGPWVDQLLSKTNPAKRLIGGTKGSHIVVHSFPGAPDRALYVEAESDGRPFFVIPWNSNFLIGTTDIRYDGDLDRVKIDENEVDYLLNETNRLFSQAGLERSSILFTYSGVRPLAYVAAGDESSITRRHFVHEHENCEGLISVIGGKLTTYRSLAEQAVDLVSTKLSKKLLPCKTASQPLPGAVSCSNLSLNDSLDDATLNRLTRIYGSRSDRIIKLVESDIGLSQTFDRETGAIAAEVVHAFRNEFAQTLSDCLLRRTMVGFNSTHGKEAVESAAEIAKQHLGWTDERAKKEASQYGKAISS